MVALVERRKTQRKPPTEQRLGRYFLCSGISVGSGLLSIK